MQIKLAGELILLKHIAPSHSNSISVVLFPNHKALQLTDVGESKTMPYNDFLDFYYDGWVATLDWLYSKMLIILMLAIIHLRQKMI